MRLTRYTDYALRVLLYLAARPDRTCAISEMSKAYGVSQNHLMKVVHELGKAGYVTSVRGRFGGIRLARPAEEINVGAVVRETEEDFDLVPCGTCVIAPACDLSEVVGKALSAFLAVLDGYTVASLLTRRAQMGRLLGFESGVSHRDAPAAPAARRGKGAPRQFVGL